MANTVFKLRRSSVAGKTPNTSTLAIGELALNLTDRKLYSSDGTNVWETGANLTTLAVSTNTTVNNVIFSGGIYANGFIGAAGQVLTSNSSGVYWSSSSGGGGVVPMRQQYTGDGSTTVFSVTGGYTVNSISVFLNGVLLRNGTEVDVTSGSTFTITPAPANGTLIDAVGPSALTSTGVSTVVSQQFTANGTSNSFAITDGYVANQVQVFLNGVKQVPVTDVDITSGTNVNFISTPANGFIVDVYGIQSAVALSSSILTVGSNVTISSNSISVGNSSVNTQIVAGNVFLNGSTLVIGNTSSNVTINSTAISVGTIQLNTSSYAGTANNASFLGGTAAASYQLNSTLNANIANYLPSYTGVVNSSVTIAGTSINPFQGMKNRIINGDMRIDQRNAGASLTLSGGVGVYPVDRFSALASQSSKLSVQRNAGSVTPPAGFTNYLGVTSLSAYTSISTDLFRLFHVIEGYNIADLAWGTSSAKSITISFWVRSSLTGTFGGCLQNSSNNRAYAFTYTITSANTWEFKSITIPGETSGTWGSTNSGGIHINLDLGSGSTKQISPGSWQTADANAATGCTSIVGTNGATWYMTGFQFEIGSIATAFERRLYSTELILCQRYFQKSYDIETAVGTATRTGYVNWNWGNMMSNATVYLTWPVRMRSSPTVTNYNPDLTSTVGGRYWNGSAEVAFTGSLSGWSAYQSGAIFAMDATSRSNMLFHWTAEIEL
jgi:hypothetical protein